jgi:hypothetical protein
MVIFVTCDMPAGKWRVTCLQANGSSLVVQPASGKALPADMALLVMGVKPQASASLIYF